MLDFEWRYPPVEIDWAKESEVSAYYVEGWQYDRDPGPEASPNPYRHGQLRDSNSILAWLHYRDHFNPPQPRSEGEWGTCTGGFRLLVFDRIKWYPVAVTIDQTASIALVEAFHLLPETLPILTLAEGGLRHRFQRHDDQKVRSLELVLQSNQILKVANFMISVHFDFETKWTTAIACVENEDMDDPYHLRLRHLLGAVKLNRGLWTHPTFLPMIFASHYCDEMRESRSILRGDLTIINRRLGISTVRSFRPELLPEDWLDTLDTRWLVTNTYARRIECIQVSEGCRWCCQNLECLLEVAKEVIKQDMLNWNVSHNMLKVMEYYLSVVEGTQGRFKSLIEEAEAATALVSSLAPYVSISRGSYGLLTPTSSVGLQRHHPERLQRRPRYNEIQKKIAVSVKEDSTSMSTFTFITALFLPGTFISTFLSLTMIDWQPEARTRSSDSSSSSLAPSSSASSLVRGKESGTEVSRYYWVFWAIDIPLTTLVMLGWYLWFRRAKSTWISENGIIQEPSEDSSQGDDTTRHSSRCDFTSSHGSSLDVTRSHNSEASDRPTGGNSHSSISEIIQHRLRSSHSSRSALSRNNMPELCPASAIGFVHEDYATLGSQASTRENSGAGAGSEQKIEENETVTGRSAQPVGTPCTANALTEEAGDDNNAKSQGERATLPLEDVLRTNGPATRKGNTNLRMQARKGTEKMSAICEKVVTDPSRREPQAQLVGQGGATAKHGVQGEAEELVVEIKGSVTAVRQDEGDANTSSASLSQRQFTKGKQLNDKLSWDKVKDATTFTGIGRIEEQRDMDVEKWSIEVESTRSATRL